MPRIIPKNLPTQIPPSKCSPISLRCGKLSARDCAPALIQSSSAAAEGFWEPSANTPYPIARTFAPPPPHPPMRRKIFVAVRFGAESCARSRHSGSFCCRTVRVSRSANPTPSARVHLPPLRSRRYFTITHRKNADGIPSVEIAANATITENMTKRQYLTASFLEYGDLYLNFSGCANDTCQSSGSCNFFKSEARIVSYVATHPPRYHISIR